MAARRWICGAKDHRKSDCKLKAQNKASPSKDMEGVGEPSAGSARKKPFNATASTSYNTGGKQTSSGLQSTSTPVKLQEMEGPCSGSGSAVQGDGQPGEVHSKGETGATTSEALLQDATKLLKSLRAPQLHVIQLDYDSGGATVLLDSGATHALKPSSSMAEWDSASPTQVTLADGVTNNLRLSKALLSAPRMGSIVDRPAGWHC